MPEPAIHLHDVVVRRGRFELRIPEWTLAAGTVVGLVGDNGSG